VVLSGCGAETVSLPDVVGLPLDEAHRTLEKLGFEEFDDQDHFEDRSIVLDANWVVVESSPAAGDTVPIDENVALRVGKRDERRAVELLPEDSAVAQEFAAEEARREEERREEAERRAAEEAAAAQESATLLQGYIDEIDPVLRLATNIFAEIDATARSVRNGTYGASQTLVVTSAVDAADATHTRISGTAPPTGSKRAGTHEALTDAAQRWADAARTLLSADGVGRDASLARFDQVRAEAQAAWNEALTALYRGTPVAPPLVP
jgi:hypothetical protein